MQIALSQLVPCDMPFPHGICVPPVDGVWGFPAAAPYVEPPAMPGEIHEGAPSGGMCGLGYASALDEIRATGHCDYYVWGASACQAAWADFSQQNAPAPAPTPTAAPAPPSPTYSPPPTYYYASTPACDPSIASSPGCGAGLEARWDPVSCSYYCVGSGYYGMTEEVVSEDELLTPASVGAPERTVTVLRTQAAEQAETEKDRQQASLGISDIPTWGWLLIGATAVMMLRRQK